MKKTIQYLRTSNKSILYVFFVLLICSSGFSYIGWDPTLGGQAIQVLLYLMLIYVILFMRIKQPENSVLNYTVLGFAIIPLLSMIPAFLVHDQSIEESFYRTKLNFFYLFFVILYYWRTDENALRKLFLVLGILWCVIEIIQQYSYPMVWFATRMETDEHELEIRYGIYRYNVCGREFGLLMFFYCFVSFLRYRKASYLCGIIIGSVGIFLLATRQIMAATLICSSYALFCMKRMSKLSLIIIIFMSWIIYQHWNSTWAEIIESSNDTINNSENARYLAYNLYGLTYNDGNLLAILLGNGSLGRNTSYEKEILDWQNLGLYRADIGVVGTFSEYGLVYIACIVVFFWKCFKNWNYIDLYLRMYLVFMLTTCIMLWHFAYTPERMTILCCIFYLIDKSIQRNKDKCLLYHM